MIKPLFRPQVAAAMHERISDVVVIDISMPLRRISVCAAIFLLFLSAFILTADYSPTLSVRGRLVHNHGMSEIELFVTHKVISMFRSGDTIAIGVQRAQHQKRSVANGRVGLVNQAAATPDETAGSSANEPLYRVLVTPELNAAFLSDGDVALNPGTQIEWRVSLKQKAVWRWLLDR